MAPRVFRKVGGGRAGRRSRRLGAPAPRKRHSEQPGSAVLLGCPTGLPDTRVSAGRVGGHRQLPLACHRAALGVEALVWRASVHTGARASAPPGEAVGPKQGAGLKTRARRALRVSGQQGTLPKTGLKQMPAGHPGAERPTQAAGLLLRTCRPGLASTQLTVPRGQRKCWELGGGGLATPPALGSGKQVPEKERCHTPSGDFWPLGPT